MPSMRTCSAPPSSRHARSGNGAGDHGETPSRPFEARRLGRDRGFIALSTGVMAQRTLLSLRPDIHLKAAIRVDDGTDYTSYAQSFPERRAIGIGDKYPAQGLKADPGGEA